MSEKTEAWRKLCPGRHLNELHHSLCEAMTAACDRIDALEKHLKDIQDLVDDQAKDYGLWFCAQALSEAYLQQALRRLHLVIEGGM